MRGTKIVNNNFVNKLVFPKTSRTLDFLSVETVLDTFGPRGLRIGRPAAAMLKAQGEGAVEPSRCSVRVLNYKSESERKSRGFKRMLMGGLLLWLARAQHDHYESESERKSWELIGLAIPKVKVKSNLQIFICNRVRANGTVREHTVRTAKITDWTFTISAINQVVN